MLSTLTPPDGMNDIAVNGAASALIPAGPPSRLAGKNLTSVRPEADRRHELGGGRDPGQGRHPEFFRARPDIDRQSGADDEPGAGVDHLVDLLGHQHRTGADVQVGQRAGQGLDGRDPGRRSAG